MTRTASPTSRVWLITGSSTGLGRQLAEDVIARGDRLIATARNVASIADLAARAPDRVRTARLDVTDISSIREAVAAGLGAFGRIDLLVNNAGYGLVGAIEEVTDEQIRAQFDTNVFGLLNVTRVLLPLMRTQKAGHILNLSSVGGQVSFPTVGIYHGTKYAVEGLSEALAHEVAAFGIKVTIVEPGAFRTDFAGRSLVNAERLEAYGPVHDVVDRLFSEATFGEPADATRAILAAVDAPEPPLRLALGADALTYIRAKLSSELADYERWEPVSTFATTEAPDALVPVKA